MVISANDLFQMAMILQSLAQKGLGHYFCFVIDQKLAIKTLSQSSSMYNTKHINNVEKMLISRRMIICYRYLKCETVMVLVKITLQLHSTHS